jgi:hypothetical protein
MQITTQLDEDHANKLAYIQHQTQQELAEILRKAIDLYYQKLRVQGSDPLAKLKQSRFIGRFKADPNLATDSKSILKEIIQ